MKSKASVEMLVETSTVKTNSLSLIREKGKQVKECTEIRDMIIAEMSFIAAFRMDLSQ